MHKSRSRSAAHSLVVLSLISCWRISSALSVSPAFNIIQRQAFIDFVSNFEREVVSDCQFAMDLQGFVGKTAIAKDISHLQVGIDITGILINGLTKFNKSRLLVAGGEIFKAIDIGLHGSFTGPNRRR